MDPAVSMHVSDPANKTVCIYITPPTILIPNYYNIYYISRASSDAILFIMDSFPAQEILGAVNIIIGSFIIYLVISTKPATRKALRSRVLLPPPPPPSPPPPPPPPPPHPSAETENDAVHFCNTTKTPYVPTIKVTADLWKAIGGEVWECTGGVHTLEERPLGATATLAAQFLRCQSEDTETVRTAKKLLEETKSIANNCLDKKNGAHGRYFEPRVVRELQLVQYLGGMVEVEANGATCTGVLLYYKSRHLKEEHTYKLVIHLQQPIDELTVIHHSISSRSWFGGPSGVKFLERSGPV
jgi:hypothetical protein